MKRLVKLVGALAALQLLTAAGYAKTFKEMFPNTSYQQAPSQKIVESFDYQQGDISLPGLGVTLKVPAEYYFFGASDAKRMLTEVWGNPPGSSGNVRGMILPASKTPIDDLWAAVISFDDDGYVSDEDAKTMDYAQMLKDMQESAAEASEERVKQGFGSIKLIGWASPPHYDEVNHKLHWAKEIEFSGRTPHTLNYNVRALGRRGVLQMNFVAKMEQLAEIQKVIPTVMAIPEFQQGFRYADYVPSTDKLAAYGIGGLIAGKVAAKLGLFALALVFLKKGFVLVIVALGALARLAKGLFSRGAKPDTE